MAHTLVISGEGVCSGGNHVTVGYILDGGAKTTTTYEVEQVRAALTSAEIADLKLLLLRAALFGLSTAAAKSKLQTGITVNIP